MKRPSVRHIGVMCHVEELHYDWPKRRGELYMPDLNCADLRGCVALFTRIDPKVTVIQTYAGSKIDTRFELTAAGWKAHLPTSIGER